MRLPLAYAKVEARINNAANPSFFGYAALSRHKQNRSTREKMDNDTRTPRDRIKEDFLRELFELENLNEIKQTPDKTPINETSEVLLRPQSMHDDCTLGGRPLAMVYTPCQKWRNLYDPETGFSKGTIFKELDLPFMGDRFEMKKRARE